MKKIVLFLVVFFSLSKGYSDSQMDSHIIDFSQIDISAIPGYHLLDWEEIGNDCKPFNYAIELAPYFNYLKETYQIERAIETGTWQGETTKCLAHIFDKVHTMEIQVDVFEEALKTFKTHPNIEAHYGNSPDILRQILPMLKNKRCLFYLDAHWFSDWPLSTELELIAKTHQDNCIIVIDDFKVPGRNDIPYDAYGVHECSYEYVKSKLAKIYSSYNYYYIIPKSINSRAKLVVIPQSWINTSDIHN